MTPRKHVQPFPICCGPVSRRAITLITERPGITAAELAADIYRDRRMVNQIYSLIRYLRKESLPAGTEIVARMGNRGGYWLRRRRARAA